MTNLDESKPKLANWRAPASSMDGVPLPSSYDSRRATRKHANGFTMRPLKMSLIAFAKLLAKPRTRPLELKFPLILAIALHLAFLVRRMKLRAARILA